MKGQDRALNPPVLNIPNLNTSKLILLLRTEFIGIHLLYSIGKVFNDSDKPNHLCKQLCKLFLEFVLLLRNPRFLILGLLILGLLILRLLILRLLGLRFWLRLRLRILWAR